MTIRKGTVFDADAAGDIYTKARKGMKEAGIDQWQGDYPSRESFLKDVESGIAYAAEEDGRIVAVSALIIGSDRTYDKIDGKWKTDNNIYGVVHRISSDPEYRSRGIASAFFELIKEMCLEAGVGSVRCDTHRDNKAMQHTLLKNGFEYCGIIICSDGTERMAFERVL